MGAELLVFLVLLSAVLRLENVENGGRGQNVEDNRLDHCRRRESARAPGPLGGGSTGSGNPSCRGKGNGGGNPSRRGERRRAGQETDQGLEADRGRYGTTEVGHGGGGGRAQRRRPQRVPQRVPATDGAKEA